MCGVSTFGGHTSVARPVDRDVGDPQVEAGLWVSPWHTELEGAFPGIMRGRHSSRYMEVHRFQNQTGEPISTACVLSGVQSEATRRLKTPEYNVEDRGHLYLFPS